MDIVSRYSIGWKIDYLGKKWPPQWYPDPPSKGKSLDEWLILLRTTDEVGPPGHTRPLCPGDTVVKALLDFGEAALRPLQEMLFHGSHKERFNAAQALLGFKFEGLAGLTPEVRTAIREAVPEVEESLLTSA